MTELSMIDQVQQAFYLTLVISGIPLGCILGVGLIISVFQAATQIQEQSLSFVPKAAVLAAVLFFFGPWLFAELSQYLTEALSQPIRSAGGW